MLSVHQVQDLGSRAPNALAPHVEYAAECDNREAHRPEPGLFPQHGQDCAGGDKAEAEPQQSAALQMLQAAEIGLGIRPLKLVRTEL